jgi:hypothetical protein
MILAIGVELADDVAAFLAVFQIAAAGEFGHGP